MLRYIFDNLYNAGVKHRLDVYTRNIMIFLCKNGFRTMFSLEVIEVFILFTIASLLWPCHAQSMNIFG